MTQQLNETDIEAAKEYLRQRLNVERVMTAHLETVMREAAELIVGICYSAGVNPQSFGYANLPVRVQMQIDEVIRSLQADIDDWFMTLAIADHEETRNIVLPLVLGENHGMTFEERLGDYCNKYRDELMLLIGAGLFLGVTKMVLAKSIGDNLRHPYTNSLLAEGIGSPPTYGRGRTNSMFTALSGLTKCGIESAWMRHWELKTEADGAIGWLVQRGSLYPCSQCDDNCGFHDLNEGTQLPQHLSCCCYAIPVYSK